MFSRCALFQIKTRVSLKYFLSYCSSTLHLLSRLGALDIDTELNSLKIKWIQRLLNPTYPLEKSDAVLSTELNSKL